MRCDIERLLSYLDKDLDLDAQLEVLEHLDRCRPCFEILCRGTRDRDARLFVRREVNKILTVEEPENPRLWAEG